MIASEPRVVTPSLPSSSTAKGAREYRRRRRHLFPYNEYARVVATGGGSVTTYCGVVVKVGPSAAVEAVEQLRPDHCPTCVDVARGGRRVRL